MLVQSLFWLSLFSVLYIYILYPLLIGVCARLFGSLRQPDYLLDNQLPTISLVIVAYNEESVIEKRIKNAMAIDYPADKIEILIATDGCTDQTNSIALSFEPQGIRVLQFHPRRGKPSVLNNAVEQAQGEIIVLSDANTMMASNSAKTLVRWFRDQSIGTVCGCLNLVDNMNGQNADGIYWKYENWIKKSEGRLRSLLGANGAIYAIRRSIVPNIPSNTLIDDFTIPLLAKINTGKSIVYDETARAYEESSPDIHTEFRRRLRIGTGGAQAISRLAALLNPYYGWTSFAFLSHKIMRWASPIFLLTAFTLNALLLFHSLYAYLFVTQILFYSFCLLGNWIHISGFTGRVIRVSNLFLHVNLAVLIGTVKWFTSHHSGIWERTNRSTLIKNS